MKARKKTYLLHRWLGLIVSLQLLAWSTGGFVFSVFALENVRGERDIASPPYDPLDEEFLEHPRSSVLAQVRSLQSTHADVATITLVDRGLGAVWDVRSPDGAIIARLDPDTGKTLGLISPEDAIRVALRDFAPEAEVVSVTLIESEPPIEYRNGALPAYMVALEHSKQPHIYVDAQTGEVTARRNRSWRIFDFFWMLHTMDYAGRDDFNHPLLTVFSVLAVLTSASGLALWGWRALHRKRRTG